MSLTRAKILRGPAKIAFGGLTLWTPDDIVLNINDAAEERRSSMYGPVDRMIINPNVTATFTPQAVAPNTTTLQELLQAVIPAIFTNGYYGTAYIGGGAEVTCTIWATGGEEVIISNAVITKPPTVSFSAGKPLLGAMTITGIISTVAGGLTLGAANSLYTSSTGVVDPGGQFTGLPTFLQQRYSGKWGLQANFTEIWPEDGWEVDFNPTWNERKVQGLTLDYELTGMEIIAKCVPMGPTMDQILAVHAIGGAAGATWPQGSLMSTQQTANDLTILDPAAATVFSLFKPVIRQPGFRFGYVNLRANELGWHSQIRFTAGVPGALASF
ncbi:MAG: hypothetical protein KGL39_17790 [Patescibacteria group bacterium]|nr:hypothetical protein [Patescibacteria group bacterium]